MGRTHSGTQLRLGGGHPPPPVSFVLTTATFAFLFLERTETSVPLSSFMVSGSFASLQNQDGTEVRVLPKSRPTPPPPPHTFPFPATARPLTSPFPSAWRWAQDQTSSLGARNGSGVRTAAEGSRARRPVPSTPPPPARAAAAGASRAGRENGRWARGGLSPAAPPAARDAGSEPRVGGGASTPPETLAGPLPPWGPPAASVFPSTPPRSPLLSRPTGAPRADASGDPATRPRPTPTRARPDPTRALQEFSPAAQSGSPRQGPHPKPSPRQAGRQAGGTSRGWRQEAEASGKPGGGRRRRAERAAVAGSAPAPYTALAAGPAAPAPG